MYKHSIFHNNIASNQTQNAGIFKLKRHMERVEMIYMTEIN